MAIGKLGIIRRCQVCKRRPQAFSTTGMCKECIDRLFQQDIMDLNDELDRWYGTPTRN